MICVKRGVGDNSVSWYLDLYAYAYKLLQGIYVLI